MVTIEQRLKSAGIQVDADYTDKFGNDRSVTKFWATGCTHYLNVWAIATVPEDEETYDFEVIHDESSVTATVDELVNNVGDIGVGFSGGLHITLPGSPNLVMDSSNVVASFDTMEDAEAYIDEQIEGGLENASVSDD